MNSQDQVKEHVCPGCGKPYSQVLHTSCTGTPSANPQAQLQLEERRAGKILLDLIDTRAKNTMLDLLRLQAELGAVRSRLIAREEISSMAGLVLRRLQDWTTKPAELITGRELASIFGELLRDYSQTTDEPGE